MDRARLILNPSAGPDRAPALLLLINEKLRTIVSRLDVTITTDAGDAARTAALAAAEGYDALYIAGGDGTLNTALRGLVSPDGTVPPIPIGVIPLGTGNDFVKALGIGEQPEPALDVLLSADVIEVDLGMVNGRPFVNTSAGGFVADVSEQVSEGLKDVTGKLAYLIGGARALIGSELLSARLTVHDAGQAGVEGPFELRMFAVCNGRFIGGGYPIAPGAAIDDGLLDVVMVCAMSRLDFIAVLQRIAAGEPDAHPDVRTFRASSMNLEFSRPVNVNTDGEVLEADRCEYRVLPRAARFFCNPAVHPRASR